jgi:hypothetical protein
MVSLVKLGKQQKPESAVKKTPGRLRVIPGDEKEIS